MQTLEFIEKLRERETTMFRSQLLNEDVARFRRLGEVLEEASDREAFMREGAMAGWTPNDMRTYELMPALGPLLEAIWELETADGEAEPAACRARFVAAWRAFDELRMERLVGCLARAPKPGGSG